MCEHAPNREAAMVVTHRDSSGKPTVWCDPCLAPLIQALNDGGLTTVASCCGHGERSGTPTEAGEGTCDNYRPPNTCLTAPSSETGRCDKCNASADALAAPADTGGIRLEGEDRMEAAGDDGVWLVCTDHGYYRPANVPYQDHDWWAPTPSEALALTVEHRRLLHGPPS